MVKNISKFTGWLIILTLLSGCSVFAPKNTTELKASGTISAREVNISPEIAGSVREVLVQESQAVKTGDKLSPLTRPCSRHNWIPPAQLSPWPKPM